jgi:hypothetical protein
VTQGTEVFQNSDVKEFFRWRDSERGDAMDRRGIEKRIEHYEQLLQAAKDEPERRAVRRLLEQERAKLQKDDSTDKQK